MSGSIVRLQNLEISAPELWGFFALDDDQMLGHGQIGSMRISLSHRDALRGLVRHELCRDFARELAGEEEDLEGPFDLDAESMGQDRFGGLSFRNGEKFVRAWYHLRSGRLVLGAYVCEWEHRQSREAREELEQCLGIMRGVKFL